ncbi:MAG: MBL fold metallo-hydrolase [Chloroflexota bacterium]
MVQLSFYGGIDEIGGNKILLEDGPRKLFLDFGFSYQTSKLFYEEYLKPRSGAGLLDPLTMGLLPPLEGLYRPDLATPGIWQQFQGSPLYRKLDHVDGVLLTHGHLDHSGYISFLKNDIPVYSTATTAFLAKAIQDSGKSGLEQQICYFTPTTYACPTGWKQPACLADKEAKQRQFCLADITPEALSPQAIEFWDHGFWERTRRQKELTACPLAGHTAGSFNLSCFPVDHSIPGACAWGIETAAGWIVYSGDLRLHGKRAGLTRQFIEQASRLHPRALILEGTNIERTTNVSEQEVYENSLKAITGATGLVFADFSPRDIDRLLTFLQIAKNLKRKLVILPKDAYLLKTMRLLSPDIPEITQEDNLAIYQDTLASTVLWQRHICEDYAGKIVLAEDVSSAQDEFILCFSFFDLNELPSLHPKEGSLYLYSSSEPHDEEQEIDFRRLHNWLEHFAIKSIGLPLEQNGQWQIPENGRGLHASGHACGTDLLEIARQINPAILIPVHSQHPESYVQSLGNDMTVISPKLGETVKI